MAPALVFFIATLAFLTSCSRSERTEASVSTNCPAKPTPTDSGDILASLPTDSGMHAVWDPLAFADVCTFEAWERKFIQERDIEASIKAGHLVPIYVHSDGSPLISVRFGQPGSTAKLAPFEAAHVRRASDEYLFVSQGMLAVSGIEYIGGPEPAWRRMAPLERGRWKARVFDIETPQGPDGKASPDVPDFVVLVNPESSPAPKYRESVETFR